MIKKLILLFILFSVFNSCTKNEYKYYIKGITVDKCDHCEMTIYCDSFYYKVDTLIVVSSNGNKYELLNYQIEKVLYGK